MYIYDRSLCDSRLYVYKIHLLTVQYSTVLVEKQQMAIRLIHNSAYNAHTTCLFKALILPLKYLAEFFYIAVYAPLPL
jgi:hypothetical protein